MEIGILDIKGALPCFENFGNLPTKIIDENNVKIIDDLDMLIIPGGSLVESNSLTNDLKKQIIEFDNIILGICSGFQILCGKIDIGRKSPTPIIKEGLNLLDVEFSPLICTDRVKFNVVKSEIFENNRGTGFHCHTYGDIKITNKKTKPLTYSSIQKLNYKMTGDKDILSGVYCNNIIGTMVHNFLDNENIRENLFNYLKIGFFAGFWESLFFVFVMPLLLNIYPSFKQYFLYQEYTQLEHLIFIFISYASILFITIWLSSLAKYYEGSITKRAILFLISGRAMAFTLKGIVFYYILQYLGRFL